MKQLLALFFTLFLFTANVCCQKEYKKFPRTKMYMKLPDQFHFDKSSTAINKMRGQSVTFKDSIPVDIRVLINSVTKNIKANIVEEIDTTICGYQAKLLIGKPTFPDGYRLISGAFGAKSFSVLIEGFISESDLSNVKESILSLKYYKDSIINPFEDNCFELDSTLMHYEISLFTDYIYLFTTYKNKSKGLEDVFILINTFDRRMLNQINNCNNLVADLYDYYSLYSSDLKQDTSYQTIGKEIEKYYSFGKCKAYKKLYDYILFLIKNKYYAVVILGCYNSLDDIRRKDILKFCETIKLSNIRELTVRN